MSGSVTIRCFGTPAAISSRTGTPSLVATVVMSRCNHAPRYHASAGWASGATPESRPPPGIYAAGMDLLVRDVRPWGGPASDMLIIDGHIASLPATGSVAAAGTQEIDGRGRI